MVENGNRNLKSLGCIYVFCSFLAIGNTCGPSEYKSADGHCCPMCDIGLMVVQDCTGDLSTTCKPCAPGTYTSEPSGLHKCLPCRHCAESQGLYTQSKCSTKRDTVCDVLDGYYCIEDSDSQCRHAIKHSVCTPGQRIKIRGTKTSDTECENCTSGFYSSSGLNCTKWTECAARDEIQIEDGSPTKDVKCEIQKRRRYGLVAFCPPVICVAVISALCYYRRSRSEVQKVSNGFSDEKSCTVPIEETNPESTTSGQAPEENNDEPINDT